MLNDADHARTGPAADRARTAPQGEDGVTPRRAAFRRLAELLALTGFAIAQPILDVTGPSPEFFLFRRPSPTEMRLLVVLVAFGPALYLWAVERGVGLISRRTEPFLHRVFVALLCAAVVVQIGKRTGPLVGAPLVLFAVAIGGALSAYGLRPAQVRQALRFAAPAPLVFLLIFVLTTPSGVLVRPVRDAALAAAVAANRPPIVLVVMDEFPVRVLLDDKGQIDARLFPNFARLAGRSTRFTNATAVSPFTARALPSMLTGQYPSRLVAPSYVEYPETLFTLLGRSYDVDAYEAISQLCPPELCTGGQTGRPMGLRALVKDVLGVAGEIVSPHPAQEETYEQFADGDDSAPRDDVAPKNPADKYNLGRVGEFLDGLRVRPDPALHFLHVLMPHAPYRLLPSGRLYTRPSHGFRVPPVVGRNLVDDARLAIVNQQRLLLQTVYADGLIGRMIDRLDESGLWNDSLVVVTADHGVGMEPGAGKRTLNERSGPDLAFVPLFVKAPGQRQGRVDPRNAQSVDLVPTVSDLLEIPVPWRVDGVSLLGPARPAPEGAWHAPPEPPRTFPLEPWAARARSGLAHRITDPDRGARGLYAVGPLRDVVGRPVGDLRTGPPAAFTASLHHDSVFPDVRLSSGTVPAMLWGYLHGDAAGLPEWLAVTVNGVVAGAVAVTKGTDGAPRFLGMADDALFRDGANDVALHVVEGDTLRRVHWGG